MKNLLMSKDRKFRLFLGGSFAVLLVCAMPLSAQTAGYDLLQTGSGASIDLSSVGLGNVALQGVPIQSSTGSTDTIMHRTQDVTGGGTTPVNVTALFMKSTSSTTFQGQQVDVYVTLNNSGGAISTSVLPQPDSLSASTGTVTVRTDGTFDSSITVNADVIFVKAGTSVTNVNPSLSSLSYEHGNALRAGGQRLRIFRNAVQGFTSLQLRPPSPFDPPLLLMLSAQKIACRLPQYPAAAKPGKIEKLT